MAKNVILYVDLLGVQNMWEVGGAIAVKNRIDDFNRLIKRKLNELPPDLHRDGECTFLLEGDSVSVLCQDFTQAIGIGIFVFNQVFFEKQVKPFWLRGSISRWHNQNQLLNTRPLSARTELKTIALGTQYLIEDDYLFALGLEKSGFKGMRLIIDKKFLKDSGREYQRHWTGFKTDLRYVTRLTEPKLYPQAGSYADILWMTENEEQFKKLEDILEQRFRHSVADSDEFTQASWTRVIFDQVNSLVHMCRNPR